MAEKKYKVWMDIYKESVDIAPYEAQSYKYILPYFSRGDMYGNIFNIEIFESGQKHELTDEIITIQYYVGGQCNPYYTQVMSNLLSIVDGEILLEIDPPVFGIVGSCKAQVVIEKDSNRISCGEIPFEVRRGTSDYLPAENVYQVVVEYLTQAEYDAKQTAGTLEAGILYIITDDVGQPYYQLYHNNLSGIQGGTTNEHYHLREDQYAELTLPRGAVKINNSGVVDDATATDLSLPNYVVATGTNDYSVTLSPPLTSYEAGTMINFFAPNENDVAAVTLNVNGLGAKSVYKNASQELSTGDIKANQIISVIYDGYNFQILSGSGSGGIAIPLYTNTTLSTESNTVSFDVPNFDKTKDILFVYANSVFLQVGVDYSLSNTEITKLSGTWDLGTQFNFVCFQMVDTEPDALGIVNIDSSFTAIADDTTHCLLNTTNYNPQNDVLYVYYQNIILFEGIDYTVNVDGISIDLTSFNIDTGEVLRYKILKKVRQSLDTTDGTLIQDGTVGNAKLATDIKVGSLASLTTDNKSTVVDAINEVDANLNLVQSMFEEGTWTPTLVGGGNTFPSGYTTRAGRYYKVGKLVNATFTLRISAKGSLSGVLNVTGLPFPNGSALVYGNLVYSFFTKTAGEDYGLQIGGSGSSTAILVMKLRDNVGATSAEASDIGETAILSGTITYITD